MKTTRMLSLLILVLAINIAPVLGQESAPPTTDDELTESLAKGAQGDGDIVLPYRSSLITTGMDANLILTTGWASGIGDYVRFSVPGNNNSETTKFQISDRGDLYVGFGTSLRTMGMDQNLIMKTGWQSGVGDYLQFYVPGNNNPATPRLTLTEAGFLDVAGGTRTTELEITGGSDLSEWFTVSEADEDAAVVPGMVVCIDPDRPGELSVCDAAYDRAVAGVISGAGDVQPGVVMGQLGSMADGDTPVALTGRVYVYADATHGSIQPGDLLTPSDVRGYAMRVEDYEKAQGATIGKAMTALPSGQGLVLVLVSTN